MLSEFGPIGADGRFYYFNGYDYIFAFDSDTGKELWKFKIGEILSTPLALSNGVLYFGTLHGYLWTIK